MMRESDPRFAHLERRVGIFLVVTAMIVVAVVAVVGVRQDLFTPTSKLVFHDESGRDLAEGMEVVTRGFRIGKVSRVRLDEAGRVEVTLAVRKSLLRWVRRDSTARVVAKALIGDSRIEISPGSAEAPPIADGDEIAFVREPDLSDIAKRVMEDVKPVLLSLKGLVEYLDNPQGDVKQAIAGVNRLASGLNETRGKVDETVTRLGARIDALAANLEALSASLRTETLPQVNSLVADVDRTARSADAFVREDLRGLAASIREELLPQLRALVADADRAAGAAGSGLGRVDRELPAILEKVNATLANLQSVSAELVPASREAAGVLRQGGELVEDTQGLVRRTQQLWPFRTGTKQPGTTVDVDSYTTGAPGAPGRPAGAGAR
jgi:phospholipid/cholesterol/gamma-HCH transport system substrate-binding protein